MRPIIRMKQRRLWHFVRLAADGYRTGVMRMSNLKNDLMSVALQRVQYWPGVLGVKLLKRDGSELCVLTEDDVREVFKTEDIIAVG